MKDIENQVFQPIKKALVDAFPGISVSSEYVKSPSSFPHACIEEQDNYLTQRRLDTSEEERFSTLMYEVNVYSNKSSGKKSQCKSMMKLIDEIMYRMNFTRISCSPVPNLEEATIYRLVARYQAETDGTNIYRR